ncbi:MAG: hypothetical protein LBV09_07375 [Deferribacteraceae bacterium]|jgi:16S rRNA (cytosine1407-C5)-methyltransferase|nr:hypothetical protein [Deferribacteraceae bacterium]
MFESFKNHLSPYINDWDAFFSAISVRTERSFRLTKSRNIPYENERYDKITDSITFQTGGAYIMNPSSILPAEILASHMPAEPLILDLSAAPGGKTCALSDLVARGGLIVANEPSPARLKALHFNLERCGAWNTKTLSHDGRSLSRFYSGVFDGVLLDAPCSHENQIATNPKIASQWSPAYVQELAKLQSQLILSAYDCLKEGGVLVYSTCTFSVEENERIIRHLLDSREDAELIKLEHQFSRGISGDDTVDECVLRILPHLQADNMHDGFFVAAISKGELSLNGRAAPAPTPQDKIVDEFFTTLPPHILKDVNGQVYIESTVPLRGDFRRTGMVFGKRAKRDTFELSSQALWEFGALTHAELRQEVSESIAHDYLKGFDTPLTNEYNRKLFFYNGIPVGVTKIVDNMHKNKLDRYFLYGKTIEW